MKRITAFILAAVMACSLLPLSAFAMEDASSLSSAEAEAQSANAAPQSEPAESASSSDEITSSSDAASSSEASSSSETASSSDTSSSSEAASQSEAADASSSSQQTVSSSVPSEQEQPEDKEPTVTDLGVATVAEAFGENGIVINKRGDGDADAQITLATAPSAPASEIITGEIYYEPTETNTLSNYFNAGSSTYAFTDYGSQLSGMSLTIGGTQYSGFGPAVKAAYDALNTDINKGVNGTAFLTQQPIECVTLNVSSVSEGNYRALMTAVSAAAYYALDWDNSAMFFSNGSVSFSAQIWPDEGTMRVSILPRATNELASLATRQSTKQLIDAKVAQLVAAARSQGSTEREMVTYFDKWLCENNVYNDAAAASGGPSNFGSSWAWCSASGLLSGSVSTIGSPVCEGYSRAMQTLCHAAGISCTVLTGDNHMWNNIKVDSVWYGVDSTWNDAGSTTNRRYLLTTNLNNSYGHTVDFATGLPFNYPRLGENEAVSNFVTRMYSVALGRTPDPSGKADWINRLNTGAATGAQVVQGFLMSDEFKDKNLSDEVFIETVYQTMFDRASDPHGKADWMDALANGMSRDYVLCGFSNSDEFTTLCESFGVTRGTLEPTQPRDRNRQLTAFVSRLYSKLLDRTGDEHGLNDWCARIITKQETPKQVAYGFVFSDEFIDKHLSDEAFVEYMYRTFLGREFDAPGKADWLNRMHALGWSREQIFDGFADSVEFGDIVASFGL